MLTLSKVTSGAAAATYYSGADDYYSEGGQAPSEWWGHGSAALGLDGSVESTAFARLLDGELPRGGVMHRGGDGPRTAAFDLTMSAPKSVSMQALIHGDNRLIEAHDRAVSRTLGHLEQQLAAYREQADRKTASRLSGNVAVARFRHEVSRDLDPQLHTHCVVLNMTQRPDGEWRALDAASLYKRQKHLGVLYRSHLARELVGLGFTVRRTHDDGRFELAHIRQDAIEAFSSRRRSIDAALAERGLDRASASAQERQMAGLATRRAKEQGIGRNELQARWKDKAASYGVDWNRQDAAPSEFGDRGAVVADAVGFALAHLTERSSVVATDRVETIALGRGIGVVSSADVTSRLRQLAATGELVLSEDGKMCTTREAVALEGQILDIEFSGRGALPRPIRPANFTLPSDSAQPLTAGQETAAQLILTTRNRVVGVQGRAGTGKTTMLKAVNDNLVDGFHGVGLAPSAAAARELSRAGVEATTIAAFIARNGVGLSAKTLVVVDEAAMVSTRDLHNVLQAAEHAGARVVLVGDTRQLASVEAGSPFRQLQQNKMDLAEMSEVRRQSNEQLRSAVEDAASGEIAAAIEKLVTSTTTIVDDTQRHQRIAKEFVKQSSDGLQTLAVAGTNHARLRINEFVRQELSLAGAGHVVSVLERRNLTRAQLRSSLSYQKDDVVQFLRKYDSLGARAGDMAAVISAEPGLVTLRMQNGAIRQWRPTAMEHVAAYDIGSRELTVGDEVRFTANQHGLGVVNGERARVETIDPEARRMTVCTSEGELVSLDLDRPLHLDHGYCVTVHSSQGQTCDTVLIDADVSSVTASESLFYVAISRARSLAAIYTDDASSLPEAMSRSEPRANALDLAKPEPRQAALAL